VSIGAESAATNPTQATWPAIAIDGSEAVETVEFGIDGFLYGIDLSAAHAEELRDRLTAYREFGTGLAFRWSTGESWFIRATNEHQARKNPAPSFEETGFHLVFLS